MVVHLAGNLPTGNANGLDSAEKKLIAGHLTHDQHLVIGVVHVSGTKTHEKEGFKPNPVITFDRIEHVPDSLLDEARELLQKLFAARTGASTLDFPDDEQAPEPPAPLELTTAAPDHFTVEIVNNDVKPRKKPTFSLGLRTDGGALALSRHNLPWGDYDDTALADGVYELESLPAKLATFVLDLIQEYRDGAAVDPTEEEIVDAQVVDDEDPTAGEDD